MTGTAGTAATAPPGVTPQATTADSIAGNNQPGQVTRIAPHSATCRFP